MPPQHTSRPPRGPIRYRNQIRRYRLQAGLTQHELAALIAVRSSTVSEWERGATCPSAALVLKLAKALGTLAEALYPQFYLHRETVAAPA